ncbi:MAG: ABC transporter ATP-binding protein [Planctomycetota bacterium]|jgi:NitT/TauT family transport system ATP-binding protein|nr:ABC transporter ATP-binding protein [Planctomycetota bacterium]
MTILEMTGVEKRFPGPKGGEPVIALRGLSLAIGEGEYVCILGKSGCGKSTLLSIAAGLEKPDAGRVVCRGETVTGPDRHRMLMFQDAALFPWLDVLDNVLYGLTFVEGLTRREKLARAEDNLAMVGLSDFQRFRIHELSGGMRQRAALARALAPDPDILLIDEPFSALDAMTREQLYADIQRIWKETGKTILMVTHNVREAVCLGERVLILSTPGEVAANEPVNLPHPRSMNDPNLTLVAAHISTFLQG